MRFSVVSLGLAGMAIGGCSSVNPVAEPEESTIAASSNAALVGRFTVEVDPTATDPEQRMRVTYRDVVDRHRELGHGVATVGQSDSVLSSATLTNNAPAAWDASGTTLRVQVKVTNGDALNNWDEPYLVITSITPKDSAACTSAATCPVAFTAHPTQSKGNSFSASPPATYTATGTTFGTYYLADMHKSGGTTPRALQWLSITDATAVTFNFTADVWATPTTGTVYADTDGDTWNTEPYSEYAGGDCSETTASGNSYQIPYAACGTAGCGATCPSGSGATCTGQSTTDASNKNCCNQTGAGNVNCTSDTGYPGCRCTATFANGSSSNPYIMTCASRSNCYAVASPTKAQPNSVACNSNADCVLDCSARGVNAGVNCSITNCNATGATCNIICAAGDTPIRCAAGRVVDPAGSIYRCGSC
jgi:hypothetical protein